MSRKSFLVYAAIVAFALTSKAIAAQQATDSLNIAPPGAPTINQSLEMRSAGAPEFRPMGAGSSTKLRIQMERILSSAELWVADTIAATISA